MLMLAGVLFVAAVICYILDKLADDTRLNFMIITRICLLLSAGLVIYSLFSK